MGQVSDKAWREAIDRNYDAFMRQIGLLLPAHAGEYALIYETRIEGLFLTVGEAEREARRRLGADKPYSIQPVVAEPDDLGWFSHVGY